MPNEVKLLPCPFCGSKRAIPERVLASEWLVMCDKCEATGPSGASKDKAIAAWNHRPTTVVTDEVVERVTRAWLDLRERLNREHSEKIISYRELKAAVNAAAVIRDASMPTVVTGEQPLQSVGDCALPCSASSPVSRSRPKAAAAIARDAQ